MCLNMELRRFMLKITIFFLILFSFTTRLLYAQQVTVIDNSDVSITSAEPPTVTISYNLPQIQQDLQQRQSDDLIWQNDITADAAIEANDQKIISEGEAAINAQVN